MLTLEACCFCRVSGVCSLNLQSYRVSIFAYKVFYSLSQNSVNFTKLKNNSCNFEVFHRVWAVDYSLVDCRLLLYVAKSTPFNTTKSIKLYLGAICLNN